MSFILNGTLIRDPNTFDDENVVIGGYTETMLGGRRRAVRAIKHNYKLGYTKLAQTDYQTISNIFNLKDSVTFVNSDLGIDTNVFVDISPRNIIAGNVNYLSNIEVTLIEE
jgi:hypothetical protein